jgi:hypothetical protein
MREIALESRPLRESFSQAKGAISSTVVIEKIKILIEEIMYGNT